MLHQMHVEIVETKKRKDDFKINKKPFVYKETDFPTIINSERKKTASHYASGDKNDSYAFAIDCSLVANEVNSKIEEEKREEESEVSQLFGTKQLQMNCCLKCGEEARFILFLFVIL